MDLSNLKKCYIRIDRDEVCVLRLTDIERIQYEMENSCELKLARKKDLDIVKVLSYENEYDINGCGTYWEQETYDNDEFHMEDFE